MVKKQEPLWSKVRDLRSLISETGSLPTSISRDNVCQDLGQALASPALTAHQKHEVTLVVVCQ